MKIGLISDTHGYFDPRIAELLAGADVILHAGDVGTMNVLDELALIAPVRAVKATSIRMRWACRFHSISHWAECILRCSISSQHPKVRLRNGAAPSSFRRRKLARREGF